MSPQNGNNSGIWLSISHGPGLLVLGSRAKQKDLAIFFFFFATGSPMYIPVWFETLQSWHGRDCDPPRLAVS